MSGGTALLEVKNLKKYYPVKSKLSRKLLGQVKAVDGISFSIQPGEVLGLVGESGCGKSTAGCTVLRLENATSGEVWFEGQEILSMDKRMLKDIRKNMQMVFQDSYSCMNPKMTIQEIIREPLVIYKMPRREQNEKIGRLLELVGLTREQGGRYPHELSGGQRQRAGIARALALEPKLIIADEPVSALDVSIQAQIINLMADLKKELGLGYLFIAHDLSVVKHISDRIAVMDLGTIVEQCEKKELYASPLHPYTVSLLNAVPIPDPEIKKERILLEGDLPSPIDPPSGCRFHPRCSGAKECCRISEPQLREVTPGHFAACHFAGGNVSETVSETVSEAVSEPGEV